MTTKAGSQGVENISISIEQFRALQNRALELAIEDRPLQDALEELMRAVETRSATGVLGSILLLDGPNLRHGAAPSLPDAYNAAIDGIEIGPGVGSCGTAAYSKAPVYVTDIGSDPLWANFRELALSSGLQACWSTPILSAAGEVLGTFAMYYPEPREASTADLEIVELITRSAALIIERRRAEEALRQTAERYRLAGRATNDAVWDWDFATNHVLWNEALEAAYGHAPADVAPTGDWWIEHIHPDDRPRVDTSIHVAIDGAADSWTDEYRFRRADGGYAHVYDRGHIIRDAGGRATRMIGAMLDLTERRRGEEDRKRLVAVIEQSTDFIGIADPQGRGIYVNEGARRMCGLSNEVAASDLMISDFFPPEDRDFVRDVVLPAQMTEGGYQGELRFRRFDDREPVPVSYDGFTIRDEHGEISAFATVTRNISERKRTEAELSSSEERLRLAVENAEIGFWDVDMVNDVLIWPPRTKAMFGISADVSVTMQDFYDGLHPDDLEATSSVYAAAADPRQRAFYDVEYRTIGKEDGIVRWVAAKGRGVFDDAGHCLRVIGTCIDVTERKRVEQALRDLNETLERRVADAVANSKLLADLVEGTDAFVQVAGPDYCWLAINKAASDEFERIYGVRPKVGLSMLDTLAEHPDHRAEVEAAWSRALAGEEFTEVGEFGDEDRDRRCYEMKFNTLRDSRGQQIGAYQFVYDVTDRIMEQRKLAAVEDALRQAQKMEAVGQLTGGIAHDFNNMLAVVIGSLDLLGRRIGGGDARAKHYVDAATEGARRAATLTQRLLAFSRQQPLKPEPINANKLVTGMSDILRHSLGGDVQLETVLGGGLWRTHVDPNQLENVILNLAINARDAMPEGGRLTIETANCHLDARYVAAHIGMSAGQYVMIAVTDTGSGMPSEVIAKAFDPFFTTKEVGKGTGLGLSQVYGFVKQSGGHVKIYSEPSEGTTIKVYLPRLVGADAEREEDTVAADIPLGDEQEVILVVEDEPTVRQFSVDALTELGYRVIEADGAAAALRLLDAHPEIAMMFTDVVMPEVNGARLAEAARLQRPGLRVLFTTGYTRNAVVHNGVLDAGVELIGKPYTIEELAAKVREVLDRPNEDQLLSNS